MSWEHRSADFCKGQVDAQMAYIDAEREVDRLERENAKLREMCGELASELRGLGVDFDRIGWCFLRDELRELGIEVGK